MSSRIVWLPGSERCGRSLADRLGVPCCGLDSRRFPDGEVYLRLLDEVQGEDVAIVAQLRDPDPQLSALLFLADALRDLGASKVGLIAPYLPYMRQDMRFQRGEAITSRSFAKLMSAAFDWLVTMDPHMHRIARLDEIYRLVSEVAASAPAIGAWAGAQVEHPCLVGPDEESRQWVAAVAAVAGCPCTVLRKNRLGDRRVELTLPDLSDFQGCTPVLVDDIISSGQTMACTVSRLIAAGLSAPICIGVHAVFAGDALSRLHGAGAARVVSCNTLEHTTNAIDITRALADSVGLVANRSAGGSEHLCSQ